MLLGLKLKHSSALLTILIAGCGDIQQLVNTDRVAGAISRSTMSVDSTSGTSNSSADLSDQTVAANIGSVNTSVGETKDLATSPLRAEQISTTLSTANVSGVSLKNPSTALSIGGCITKSIGLSPIRQDGYRFNFAWPVMLELELGSTQISQCIKLTGVGEGMTIEMHRGSPVSINGAAFISGPQKLTEGDEVRVKFTVPNVPDASVEEYALFGPRQYLGTLKARAANKDRAPEVFQVGPTRNYKQINEVTNLLRAGDTVEVDSGNYAAVEFTRAGTAAAPITIKGVGPTRPVISGSNWTVSFKNSHRIVFENFEVTGGNTVCVRTMAHDIVVKNVFIHDCPRLGVLGADLGNGVNIFDRVEIARTGAIILNEPFHHAMYIATDRDAFPNAILRIQNSYFHDNKGNSIKSRSARNEIYSNWIDVPNHPEAYYALELIGFQEYTVDKALNSDIVGNVLINRNNFGMRFGGDGVGSSKGRIRMANNTIVISKTLNQYDSVIRLSDELDSLYLLNNAFVREDASDVGPTRLFYNGVNKWVSGVAKVSGSNNIFPTKTYWDQNAPLSNTVFNGNLFVNSVFKSQSVLSFDATPASTTNETSMSTAMTTIEAGYEIENPLTTLSSTFSTAPKIEGAPLPYGQPTKSKVNVGAQ